MLLSYCACSGPPAILDNFVNTRHTVMTVGRRAAQLTNMSHFHGCIRVTSKPCRLQICEHTPSAAMCSGDRKAVPYDRKAEAHRIFHISWNGGLRSFDVCPENTVSFWQPDTPSSPAVPAACAPLPLPCAPHPIPSGVSIFARGSLLN